MAAHKAEVIDGRKACASCGQTKDLCEFARDRTLSSGRTSSCKVCRNRGAAERTRQWRQNNPEKRRRSARDYYHSKGRFRKLQQVYGVTFEQYAAMLEAQNGGCAICGQSGNRALCVDHDHKTGRVRGLLCISCNSAIGMLREDRSLFEAALTYLESGS